MIFSYKPPFGKEKNEINFFFFKNIYKALFLQEINMVIMAMTIQCNETLKHSFIFQITLRISATLQ